MIYENGSFSGNMPIYAKYFDMNGGTSTLRSVKTSVSSLYLYNTNSLNSFISVKTNEDYMRVSGEGINSITFDTLDGVSIDGNDIKYEMCYHVDSDEVDCYLIEGGAEEKVVITDTDNNLTISGSNPFNVNGYYGLENVADDIVVTVGETESVIRTH